MSPTRAMVLAAGLGIRMRPLTALAPKPALPVLSLPLIGHVLEHLASHGVTFVVINSHHMPRELEEAARRSRPASMEVAFSHESSILGTAGGLKKAAKHFGKETFYLVNSDSMTDADLTAAAAAHHASGRAATLVVRAHDPGAGYRPVSVAAAGDAACPPLVGIAGRRWGRGEAVHRTFTGVHVMEPSVLEAIPAATPCDINADIYPWLLDENPDSVGTWLHEGWWFEAGGPARYLELNLELLARSGRDAVIGSGYRIDPQARVSRSVVGARVRLARGAEIDECVLWDDVTVGEGVTLKRCIVTSGVEVPLAPMTGMILMSDGRGGTVAHPMDQPA